MPKKDYRGFLAVVGEQLRQRATEEQAKAAENDLDRGVIMGWAFALDTLWDYLGLFGLVPEDLNWQGFEPERDLPGAKTSPTGGSRA